MLTTSTLSIIVMLTLTTWRMSHACRLTRQPDSPPLALEPAAHRSGAAHADRGGRVSRRRLCRSAGHHRRAGLAQAVQVCHLHGGLQPDAGLGLRLAQRLAPDAAGG